MNVLLENPLPIWAFGAVCLAVSLVIVLTRRSLGSILGVAAVIAGTLLLVFLERWVVTPSEEVEEALTTLMASIEANDLPAVLATIDPSAQEIRAEAERIMPQVAIRETAAASVRIEVVDGSSPLQAISYFRGRFDGTHARSGGRIFYFDKVEIDWQHSDGQWLIVDYRAEFRGKPIRATEGFRMAR